MAEPFGEAVAFEIARATVGDLPAIAEIERRAFDDAWSEAMLASTLGQPDSVVLVARQAGEVTGSAAFQRAADEAELLRLAVEPRSRRRGLGAALLKAGLERLAAAGITLCHLEVRADNEGARRLYEQHGFEVVGRRRGYYEGGIDAVLYSLRLTPAEGS